MLLGFGKLDHLVAVRTVWIVEVGSRDDACLSAAFAAYLTGKVSPICARVIFDDDRFVARDASRKNLIAGSGDVVCVSEEEIRSLDLVDSAKTFAFEIALPIRMCTADFEGFHLVLLFPWVKDLLEPYQDSSKS